MVEFVPLFAPPGGPELLIILVIAIMLFGASKIPKLARSSGEAMGEFKKGREKVEQELDEMRETGNYDDPDDDGDTVTEPEPETLSESESTPN